MSTLIVAVLSFVGFLAAYHTYGRWLGKKIFRLNPRAQTPALRIDDGMDFVPTRKSVLFGHHFTSIAGTGPIVGPAIAVFWGWLPALLWVVFGSIFIGAVHDFGALVISMRSRGQTIGDVAGRVIGRRARLLLLLLLLLELTVVLAVFGLVIATIFDLYKGGVLAVWVSLPIAILIGLWHYKWKKPLFAPSILAVVIIYVMVWVGDAFEPVNIISLLGLQNVQSPYLNGVTVWTVILFIYCFLASVLPVWLLLQPRDYVNSNQLYIAMAAILVGIVVAGAGGQADLFSSAPAVAQKAPADAPPLWPFLFITVACGAVSGFHSLVSSGTSSKQLAHEPDARLVGYGAMLLEGALAIIVILACCAGVGMGLFEEKAIPRNGGSRVELVRIQNAQGQPLQGRKAWEKVYNAEIRPAIDPRTGKPIPNKTTGGWGNLGLDKQLGAFIEGAANFLHTVGIPLRFAIGMLGVMAACFAATTLDTATRLQRYVIEELGRTVHIKPLTNKFVATGLAVVSAGALAIFLKAPGKAYGSGGLILWPMFGASNQILAGLGFLVIGGWLILHRRPIWFLLPPAVIMLILPAWAMGWSLWGWMRKGDWLLVGFGVAIELLTAWLVLEAVLAWFSLRRRKLLRRGG